MKIKITTGTADVRVQFGRVCGHEAGRIRVVCILHIFGRVERVDKNIVRKVRVGRGGA